MPARVKVCGRDTNFYVVTSKSSLGPDFVSALVTEPHHSHIEFSPAWDRQFEHFADSVSDCVLVGLVDQTTSRVLDSQLNSTGRTMQVVAYVNPARSGSDVVRRTALDTLQSAISMQHGTTDPPLRSGAGAHWLTSFYVWL
jgi:hypothetical protein